MSRRPQRRLRNAPDPALQSPGVETFALPASGTPASRGKRTCAPLTGQEVEFPTEVRRKSAEQHFPSLHRSEATVWDPVFRATNIAKNTFKHHSLQKRYRHKKSEIRQRCDCRNQTWRCPICMRSKSRVGNNRQCADCSSTTSSRRNTSTGAGIGVFVGWPFCRFG